MPELHEILAERVTGWRTTGYAHDAFPAIGEILEFARNEDGSSRYLREPQIRALETYWYLRLVEGTPRIEDLYLRMFEGRAVLEALGLLPAAAAERAGCEAIATFDERFRSPSVPVRLL